jgi:hypothetical protein
MIATHVRQKKTKAQVNPVSCPGVSPDSQASLQFGEITFRKRDPKTLGTKPLLSSSHAIEQRHDPSSEESKPYGQNGDVRT